MGPGGGWTFLSSDQLLFWCRCGAGAGRCCHACLPSQYNFRFAPLILQLYLRIMRAQPSHQEVLSCSLICFLFFYIHCIYYNRRSAPVGVRYLLLLLGQEIRPKKEGQGISRQGHRYCKQESTKFKYGHLDINVKVP